jgi:hypothetical protein
MTENGKNLDAADLARDEMRRTIRELETHLGWLTAHRDQLIAHRDQLQQEIAALRTLGAAPSANDPEGGAQPPPAGAVAPARRISEAATPTAPPVTVLQALSLRIGFYFSGNFGAVGVLAHSGIANQVWIFLIRIGDQHRRAVRFAYRTIGDAANSPRALTRRCAGWHWPWQNRIVSGRN